MPPLNAKKALLASFSNVTLLCIAVAVSLATLAWINGLPTANLFRENLQVTDYLWGTNYAYVDVILCNNGTQSVSLRNVKVNAQPASVVYIAGSSQIRAGESVVLRVATASAPAITCQIAFQTTKGNLFVFTVTAE
jgi:hypothetical protein